MGAEDMLGAHLAPPPTGIDALPTSALMHARLAMHVAMRDAPGTFDDEQLDAVRLVEGTLAAIVDERLGGAVPAPPPAPPWRPSTGRPEVVWPRDVWPRFRLFAWPWSRRP